MANIFVISDTHFNHENILKFTHGETGKRIRPEFESVTHMNEHMIERWYSVVKPQDKVYHLGDVYFGSQSGARAILSRLNGHKRLIIGNHDCIYGKGNPLHEFFEKMFLWRPWGNLGIVLSHIPLREDQMNNRFRDKMVNVHGHNHQNDSPSERHINVSVEKINYTPVHIDDIRQRI